MVVLRWALSYVLYVLRARGYNRKRIAIAVASDLGVQVCERLRNEPGLGFEVVGYFDDRRVDRLAVQTGIPVLGTVRHMGGCVQQHDLDQVWMALPLRAEDRIRHILHELRHSTVDIKLVPDIFQFFLLNQSLEEIGGLPVHTLAASPMQGANRLLKAAEDRVLAALILVLISPVLLLVALAVRCSSAGPILFKQQRHGWNGKTIEVWKFRTMTVQAKADGLTLVTRGDPRVTSVGAFLRRTSLDELPQFFNVLQGRMSIVGPRPHPIEINEAYADRVDRYMLRHKVKPGITGWAQINGLRGALDTPDKMERRVQHDLFYIEHWSIWFDLHIVLLTIFKGFVHENAY
jgi:putative colanic acid biosynthesis UDP-glucose lipid carrier transferase